MTGSNIADNIKKYRKLNKMTQQQLGDLLGVHFTTVSSWEKGHNKPLMDKASKMAQIWGIKVSDIIGDSPVQKKVATPAFKELKGIVAAGSPLEMFEVPEMVSVPYEIDQKYPNAYLLEIRGDSMNKLFIEGTYVLIDPCDKLENGEIGVVRVNHTEATLKRFFKVGETIMLQPESTNSDHQNQMYDCTKGECDSISILGKLVWAMTPIGMKF